MNFWKPIITFYLTIASVDIAHGVPLRPDDTKPTKDESPSSDPSSSTPYQPKLVKTYAKTVKLSPQKIDTKQGEKPQSNVAIQNQKKRERRKKQKAQKKAVQDSLTRMLFSDLRKESALPQRDLVKKNTNNPKLLRPLNDSVLSSSTITSQAESTSDWAIALSQKKKEKEIKEISQSSKSLKTASMQDNIKEFEEKGSTKETKLDGSGSSQEHHSATEEVLTSQSEIIAKMEGKSSVNVVDNNFNTPTDSQQILPTIKISKRWGDISSDDEEWPSLEQLQKIKLKKTEENEMEKGSKIKSPKSEARDGNLPKRAGKKYDISHHYDSAPPTVSIEKHKIGTGHIPVQPGKATSDFLSALKEAGILGPGKGEKGKSIQLNSDKETSGIYKRGVSTNIKNKSSIKYTIGNVLTITFRTIEAFKELEQSNINPIVFAVTRIVRLHESGLMIVFHSNKGANHLQNKMAEIIEDIHIKLDIKITYFKYNIVCIHDIPQETTIQELVHIFQYQYQEKPYSIWFATYRPGIKDTLKIALLDVDYSLLVNIKQNSIIHVQNMRLCIEICLLSGLAESEYLMSQNNAALLRKVSTYLQVEALIPKILKDISKEEIFWSFRNKYNEVPMTIQFMPYTNISNMKMALLKITERLLAKIIISPNIQIRWSERVIITNIKLYRCEKCQRLGHQTENCHQKYREPPTPHENCVDCSLFNGNYSELDMKPGSVAKNSNHITGDDECITKHLYVWKTLQKKNSRHPFIENYIKNEAFENDNYINQYFEPAPQFKKSFKKKKHEELVPAASKTSISSMSEIVSQPTKPHIIPHYLNSTSNIKIIEPTSSDQKGKRIPAVSPLPPSTESLKLYSDTTSVSPFIKTSHVKPTASAQEVDFSTSNKRNDESVKELMTGYEEKGPESSFINIRNHIIVEALQQSVQKTLTNALPSIYKMIIETVYENIQETVSKLATTAFEKHGNVSSEKLSNTEYIEKRDKDK